MPILPCLEAPSHVPPSFPGFSSCPERSFKMHSYLPDSYPSQWSHGSMLDLWTKTFQICTCDAAMLLKKEQILVIMLRSNIMCQSGVKCITLLCFCLEIRKLEIRLSVTVEYKYGFIHSFPHHSLVVRNITTRY